MGLWEELSGTEFSSQGNNYFFHKGGESVAWKLDQKSSFASSATDSHAQCFIFLGSKIAADGDCSHEIKRHSFLGRKAMTNLDSLLKKQRHHFADKGRLVKAMIFPVVMYGCESWTIKKAEHRRIDNFELWCWRRLLWSLAWQEIEPVNPKGNQP